MTSSTNPRKAQYLCIEDESCRMGIARSIIASKLHGLYNLIRYEAKYRQEQLEGVDQDYAKAGILSAVERLQKARNVDELSLLEAEGSRAARAIIIALFPKDYGFTGRKPRRGGVINPAIDSPTPSSTLYLPRL